MYYLWKSRLSFSNSLRILSIAVLMIVLPVSCAPNDESGIPLPADSLLLRTPYMGDETELRDPPPATKRIYRDESSVEGWLDPPLSMLRFPVELRESPRLMFRLGMDSRISFQPGDLKLRVEYHPESEDTHSEIGETIKYILFQTTPETNPVSMFQFINFDIDLSEYAPGKGELRFISEGRLSGNDDIDILWGQPVIYYPNERRNKHVLLIGVDTLRFDVLSIYGGRDELTPNIQRLVGTGTVFTNNHGQAPFTGPSFGSMLTGKYPSGIAPTISTVHIPPYATTVAERLRDRAWATSMVCGNPYLGSERSGFTEGMESVWYRNHATPDVTVDRTIEMIELNHSRDIFMFIHIMDPHFPYDPPLDLIDSLCDRRYRGRYRTEFNDMAEWNFLTEAPPDYEVTRVKELYDAEVADMDRAIGRLFEYLETNELLENTLVILASDHGEEFFEHSQYGHGQSLYEEMIKLPLVVWGEGFPGGTTIDTTVSNIDIVPTILDYLGEPIPDDLPGIPLQDIASGEFSEDRMIFGEGNLRRGYHTKFVIDWPYKCITDYFTGETMLFNLEEDPGEMNDLSRENPELTGKMSMEGTLRMPPLATMFVVFIAGDPQDSPSRFTGMLTIPGGVAASKALGLVAGDDYYTDGDSIHFDFNPDTEPGDPNKALIIFPYKGGSSIVATVLMDGMVDPERFYPYGSDIPEPSGQATVNVYDLPWPNRMPVDIHERPAACYILGIPGFPPDEDVEFDYRELEPQTLDQLRALGYIN